MGRRRILVVSDDRDFLEIYATVLRFMGFDVRRARSAESGYDAALADGVRVVVTDFPTLAASGRPLTALLRDDPRTAALRVLCVTSWVSDAEIARAYRCGADHVLPMPTSPRSLGDAVERLAAG